MALVKGTAVTQSAGAKAPHVTACAARAAPPWPPSGTEARTPGAGAARMSKNTNAAIRRRSLGVKGLNWGPRAVRSPVKRGRIGAAGVIAQYGGHTLATSTAAARACGTPADARGAGSATQALTSNL